MGPRTRELKESVREYYDRHGWRSLDNGSLVDVRLFVDQREVCQVYRARERRRDREFLPTKGRFFLDAASGALPYADYSQEWEYHVCVDFSITGLREARKRSDLGSRGLYVSADLCHLPFTSDTFEAVLSAHTLYHIPQQGQAEASAELLRVLAPRGALLILYSNIKSLSFRIKRLWERLTGRAVTLRRQVDAPEVFSEVLPRKRLEAMIRDAGGSPVFRCHSFMSQQMLQRLIPNNRLGHCILRVVYWFETACTRTSLPLGHYFSIQIRKSGTPPER